MSGESPFAALPPSKESPQEPSIPNWIRLWFGIERPVSRRTYAISGVGLMLLKYVVEAVAILWFTGNFYAPWDFLNPVLSMRAHLFGPGQEWLGWAIFLWSLPFLWIAVSMSVRRSLDAGISPWFGLIVLVPLVNLVSMLALCAIATDPRVKWLRLAEPSVVGGSSWGALIGIIGGLAIGALMMAISVYLFASYGAALFIGTPFVMGTAAAYIYNREHPRSYLSSIAVGLASIACAGAALLLFAFEGLICVMMAAPLLMPIGALGGLMGKIIAETTRRPEVQIMAAIVLLPILAGGEMLVRPKTEYEVLSSVQIDAPPEVVWENVVDFPDLPEPTEWYFRLGIAAPQRARIVGTGRGATRYCEFTTGEFVEPITAWDYPNRLAFNVTSQAPSMFELSPYEHVHPPHLDGYLRSNRGEFRLVRLADGGTQLEGRTWYEFDMFPQSYWTLWSDLLIHRIHDRVLTHIKRLSEPTSERQ